VEEYSCKLLTLDLVDGLGKATDVLASDTGNGDTTILGGIDGVLV
jgi:hypothetical protein